MKCPTCQAEAYLISPGYEHSAPVFRCYSCDPYGRAFSSDTAGAWAESDASKAASRAERDRRK